jgi:HAD superfamily hydrolase (TIGR01509 family)
MRDLDAYREVSAQPPARRDMSIACAPGLTDEDLGDRVRGALSAEQAEWVEEVAVAARTPVGELPGSARARIGIADDQENLLVRVVLRHPLLRSVLRRLPGRKLVFSNSPVHYSRAVLALLRVADLFDDVFSIEHTGYQPKPDRRGFLRLLRRYRLQPHRCVMVEDSLANLKTAKRLGMRTVWVGGTAKAPACVDLSIRHVAQLPRMLRALRVS